MEDIWFTRFAALPFVVLGGEFESLAKCAEILPWPLRPQANFQTFINGNGIGIGGSIGRWRV
jgi:hypothetical protein